jgi:hypothetical protein
LARTLAAERRRAREFAETHRRHIDRLEAELAEQIAELADEVSQAGAPPADETLLLRRIEELELERDQAIHRLAEAEATLAKHSSGGDSTKLSELRRAHEMALCDLRELRKRNADPESQLTEPRRAGGNMSGGDRLDWESQKRRILASLEAEGDEVTDDREDERMTIDGTIKITDAVIVDKDREIAELKQMLADQSQAPAANAETQAAQALLDADETIRVERERLKQKQAEWEEKLRLAEIEVSQERAKIARERVELEEKRRALEQDQGHREHEIVAAPGKPQEKKSGRGRWLARLGLTEKDDE